MTISKAQIKWVRSLQQKKFRDEAQLFVAEGDKCISELLPAFEVELLIVDGTRSTLHDVPCSAQRLVSAGETEIAQMSSLRTPQGSIAVFRQRPNSPCASQYADFILALDGVQDPGNLGTIIRTCDWFGVHQVVCSKDTADCYNPKVVQATMGALARVQVDYVDLPAWLEQQQMPVYGTLLDGRNIYWTGAIAERDRGIIVMGNEGNGISEAVRPLITHPLYIPSAESDRVESLNVAIATAVTLAEFRRPNNTNK
ncbi:MAG: RNA methyltransferase [Paludibacteraceae bacterium]|nr:RNA methyltransferase [Paludibacteraceae bacterium]